MSAMQEILAEHNIGSTFEPTIKEFVDGLVLVTIGTLNNGFELPQANLVVITEKDVFGRQKKKLYRAWQKSEKIAYFRDINIGDYVVHVNHGIGKIYWCRNIGCCGDSS